MVPSKLQSCVWRGEEGDGTSFQCLHPENNKGVTPEICGKCPLRLASHLVANEPVPEKSLTQTISRGVAGLTKAALGIDRASEETIQARWEICKSCEFFKLWRCKKCGCLVPAKIRQISEKCPLQKW